MYELLNSNNEKKKEENVINYREDLFNDAKTRLKSHFFGIDDVIDEIFKQIEVWFLYPEFLIKPTIINLWGLTGVGKSDFVYKLGKYLGLSDKFCAIETNSDYYVDNSHYRERVDTVTDALVENGIRVCDQSILLLDEIHQNKSLRNDGEDNQNRRYNDLWKLLSDGVLYSQNDILKYIRNYIRTLKNILNNAQKAYFEANTNLSFSTKMAVVNGFARDSTDINGFDSFNAFFSGCRNSVNIKKLVNLLDISESDMNYIQKLRLIYQKPDQILRLSLDKNNTTEQILDSCSNKIMLEFLEYKYKELAKNDPNDFTDDKYTYSKMLIFICGNLKENMYITENNDIKNPTKNEIKEFLRHIFRPEQIARFGDNYIIYPVLSEDDFDQLINREINIREKQLQVKFNKRDLYISKEYRDLIKIEINKVSINPLMGTRPVLSLVGRILGNIIPKILVHLKDSL
jgi:cell division protease FtsH